MEPSHVFFPMVALRFVSVESQYKHGKPSVRHTVWLETVKGYRNPDEVIHILWVESK